MTPRCEQRPRPARARGRQRSVTKTSALDAARREQRRRQLGAPPRDVEPAAGAGDRVDDDGDAQRAALPTTSRHRRYRPLSSRSTFGVHEPDQRRRPRRDVRLSTSMRQTPPFLNGSGRGAPIRCAASSPRPGSWPTSAMRRRRAALASCAIDGRGLMPGRQRVEQLHGRLARRRRPRADRPSAWRAPAGW